jgi:hypothetical protein
MKRSTWAQGNGRSNASQKKAQRQSISQILRDSYRLHARDRVTQKAVKHCLR